MDNKKTKGEKIARFLYGGHDARMQIENLLNLYSLFGPEYINNEYLPIGTMDRYGNYGLIGALENYKRRTGANMPAVQGIYNSGIKFTPEGGYNLTEADISNIGQRGFDLNWYPNRYQTQYRNVINQLQPYVDHNAGQVGLKGTYHNTLPRWLQPFTHPLQIDVRY